VKHFVGNNHEGPGHNGRLRSSPEIGEQALRELYYPPYAAAAAAGVGAAMCSYNLVNGTYACENAAALSVLKEDLNFSGWVMSDWGADHGSVGSLNAGMDQTMGAAFSAQDRKRILAGDVPQSRIDDAVMRVLTPLFTVGVFDRTDYGNSTVDATSAEHDALAADFAKATTVLLKNDAAILPLKEDGVSHIAVVGDEANVKGGGSGAVWAKHIVTPTEGLRSRLAGKAVQVLNHSIHYDACGMGQCDQDRCTTRVTASDIAASVALAQSSDVVIVNVAVTSTEGYDRYNLSLSGSQDELVSQVADANPNTIVVVRCPGAILMPWASKVKAIIVQFLPGQASGEALASVLFGDVNPSARLPLSFPASESQSWLQSEAQYPGESKDGKYVVSYTEGLNIGYRWFDAEGRGPLFEFGAGLSYTTFSYSNASASAAEIACDVSNTGSFAGHEVAQLYLAFQDEPQPPKLLRGFVRLHLQPGESQRVRFPVSATELQVWDTLASHWRKAHGKIVFHIGASSRDIRLKGDFAEALLV